MKTGSLSVVTAALFASAVAFGAQAGNNPVDEDWWPSEFGADDQAGATNYITPEKRMAAAQLVKTGRVATQQSWPASDPVPGGAASDDNPPVPLALPRGASGPRPGVCR